MPLDGLNNHGINMIVLYQGHFPFAQEGYL